MTLGAMLVLAALSLFVWNQIEAKRAGESADQILAILEEQTEEGNDSEESFDAQTEELEIDGYQYIGYLSFPSLGLELPVMSDWDYARLKISPCRYAGSVKTDDLVIAAHNYSRHFGPIRNLNRGDAVIFTDVNGTAFGYTVTEVDILTPSDVKEMTAGDYDLTLFTCTYGGQSRVTVRCDSADEKRKE